MLVPLLVLVSIAIVAAVALVTFFAGRVWPLVALVPAVLAGAAWYGWEFSSEATVFVAAIAILGYAGVALGAGVRRSRTR